MPAPRIWALYPLLLQATTAKRLGKAGHGKPCSDRYCGSGRIVAGFGGGAAPRIGFLAGSLLVAGSRLVLGVCGLVLRGFVCGVCLIVGGLLGFHVCLCGFKCGLGVLSVRGGLL